MQNVSFTILFFLMELPDLAFSWYFITNSLPLHLMYHINNLQCNYWLLYDFFFFFFFKTNSK